MRRKGEDTPLLFPSGGDKPSGREESARNPRMKGIRLTPEECARALADWSLAPEFLTVEEASFLTDVPVSTLYKWSSEGKLKGVAKTIGKTLRFDREALRRMWRDERKTAK